MRTQLAACSILPTATLREAIDALNRGGARIALIVDYTPGDLRTRDVAGMLDAICHLLERSGLIEHDGLIRDCTWHEFPMDRTKPQATVTLRTLEAKP